MIVSNDSVVYQKDFGPTTLDEFKKMELFNPDQSWTPVEEDNSPVGRYGQPQRKLEASQ